MKMTLQKRSAIARSLYRLVMTNTQTLADDFGIVGNDGHEYSGEYPIGSDLAYLMGAILDGNVFDAVPGINALTDWLRAEHPRHAANRFVVVSTE